ALNVVTGAPYWVGVVTVALIVAVNVAIGGMRGITYVQAFQFWVKVFAISIPVVVLLIHFGGLPGRRVLFGDAVPRAGVHGLSVSLSAPERVTFPRAGSFSVDATAAGHAGHVGHVGHVVHVAGGGHVILPAGV